LFFNTKATPAATVVNTVSDTGIGKTPDEQFHLFARFYRARTPTTAGNSGPGWGALDIKQYVEHMGGT